MSMKERHAALLDYVMQNGKTEVNTLAELLQTSKVTVRKDLDYLSERGLLKRERGYAAVSYTHLDVYKRQRSICLHTDIYSSTENGTASGFLPERCAPGA